jgi:hypothetical protein
MDGNQRSSTSYAMVRAQPSLSLSPRLKKYSEDLLSKVGAVKVVGR